MKKTNFRLSYIVQILALSLASIIILAGVFGFSIKSAKAAGSYIVNSTVDTSDANPGDGICDIGGDVCTLRAAIEEANANIGADTVTFDPTILPATITPATALPALTDADTTISGPGSDQFTIDGTSVVGDDGLKVQASGASISGLKIINFGQNGISLSNANNITISNNTVNSNSQGGITLSNANNSAIIGNTFSSNARGIRLYSADSNTITGNTVSSNTLDGISFSDSDNNQVSSNTFFSNGMGTSYQTNPNYISYDDGNSANTNNPMAYVTLQANGVEKGANFLVGGNYSAIKNNGDPVAGLDGTQDLYLALITDDPGDNNQYTFYTDKSQGDFLTWCQANVNALCNIDYYSSVPVWQHNGAYNNYTWNATALPSGMGVSYPISSSVSTSYYDASSILSVNYGGSDYNQALLLGLGVPVVFYVGIPASGAGVFNIMIPGLVNNVFGFDGTTDLDLLLLDDTAHGGITGKSAWVVPNSISTSSLIGLLSTLGDDGNPAIEVCREPSVFTGNGDGNDYTFKPIVSWTVCSGATMSNGFADPATMIGYPATPPALDAGSGIYLQNSKSNTFTSNILTSNGNTYVISGTSDSNTFTDDVNTTPIGHDYEYSSSGNNTINNVDIAANGANGQNTGSGTLSVYYKTRAFIHNGQNIPIASAPVSFKDSGGIERASDTTDIGGYTAYHLLLSYTQTSTTFNSYNDYSIFINAPGYSYLTKNATINNTNITIEAVPGVSPIYSPAPVPIPPITPPVNPPVTPPTTPPVENPPTENPPVTPINQPLVCSDTLSQVQATPIPEFDPNWGLPDRVNWALQHRENVYNLYVIYLNRQPCADEINWWLQTEPNIDNVKKDILGSNEYLKNNQPTSNPITLATGTYIIQPGDSLKSIAQQVYGDSEQWGKLVDLNKDQFPSLATNPEIIYSGWELKY